MPVILDKLPDLLCSLSQSINCVLVLSEPMTWLWQSELSENFNALSIFLNSCGKDVWLSGPLPTLSHGAGHFSRILSLNTSLSLQNPQHWIHQLLQPVLEPSFPFNPNPNSPGSTVLAANIQHAIQTTDY